MPWRRAWRAWRRILPVAAHPRLPGARRAACAVVQFVAEVGQRVGFAVAVSGESGADGGEQVGLVETHGGEVRALPADFCGQGQRVGKRLVEEAPYLGQGGQGEGEAGDDVPGVAVSRADLLEIDRVTVRKMGH